MSNVEPLVSVIVSVYNTGRYLEECLLSTINQTMSNIEIICVDDKSSDNSVCILDEYGKKDRRIKIIKHENNCGLLKTRGDGVRAASGKYILFLDSDDTLELNACRDLSSMMDDTGCDIIQFGTNVIPYENADSHLSRHYELYLRPCVRTMIGDDIFKYQFSGMANWHVWNKIYKTDVCRKSYECAGDDYLILTDDLYISFYNMYFSKKMKGTRKKYYNYNIGRGYTKNSNTEINRIRTISCNSWFIYDCIDFLKKEGIFEKYGKYCFREPLLQMGVCVSMMKTIEDEKIRNEALQLIDDCWNREPFKDLLQKMISDDNWNSVLNRMKRHISDYGLMETMKVMTHMTLFKIRKVI